MRLREAVAQQPAELAKISQQLLDEKQKLEEESLSLQKKWDEERTRWQPELDRLIGEFRDNSDYIAETASMAESYINPVIQKLTDRLLSRFPQVSPQLAHIPSDPHSRTEPHLVKLRDEIHFHMEPAAAYQHGLHFSLYWGTPDTHYFKGLLHRAEYEKADMSDFKGFISLSEININEFGLLYVDYDINYSQSIRIPLHQWEGKPDVVKGALEVAFSKPNVVKYDRLYVAPPPSYSGW